MIYRYHFRVIIFFVPGNEEQNENLMHRYIHSNESDYFVDTRAQSRCSYASLRKTIHDIDTATCNALNERIRIRHARERSCMPLSVLVDQVFFSTVFL